MNRNNRLGALLSVLLMMIASSVTADSTITYQGQLKQSGVPFSGTANLEFRLYDALVGGSMIAGPISRPATPVAEGLFQVELDFGLAAFSAQVRYLEVRVSGTPLTPRQAVRPAPMALFALDGNQGPPGPPGPSGVSPKNVLWVADTGGDYATVQAALDAIDDASEVNPYLVRIAPGIYPGPITLKDHVDIAGSGRETTVLVGSGGAQFPGGGSESATVRAAGPVRATLRDLTVESVADGAPYAQAVDVDAGGPGLHLERLLLRASGGTSQDAGMIVRNSLQVRLESVDIEVMSDGVWGMLVGNSTVSLRDSTITIQSGLGLYVNDGSVFADGLTVRQGSGNGIFMQSNADQVTVGDFNRIDVDAPFGYFFGDPVLSTVNVLIANSRISGIGSPGNPNLFTTCRNVYSLNLQTVYGVNCMP